MALPDKDVAVQFRCDEARELARSLMEAAHNAETDSAIFRYLVKLGAQLQTVAQTLTLIREARKEAGLE